MSISVKELSFSYGDRPILCQVSFTARRGQLLSILGPNGVGKSTLFRCILGLLKGYSGTIEVDGRPIRDLNPKSLAALVAYIPQSSYPSFSYTVLDMVLMGTSARLSPLASPGKSEEYAARDALERLGIASLAARPYTQLSGGERQMVLIARALVQNSRILLMDEPTANLDYGNQMRVLSRVRALAEEGYAILQSTHNPDQAYLFSHELLAMKDGRVLAQGPPCQVFTEALIRDLYGLDVEISPHHGGRFLSCIPRDLLYEKKEEEE